MPDPDPGLQVLVAAHDAGGADALAPMIPFLRTRGHEVSIQAAGPAVDRLDARRTRSDPRPPNADAVLAGTSLEATHELEILKAAGDTDIPTMALIDSWTNYRERFEDADGNLVLPDAVATPDERAAEEAAEAGLPADRIYVAGQPALDALARAAEAWSRDEERRVRRRLGVETEDRLVTFFGQPMADMHPPGSGRHRGYDEGDAFDLLGRLVEMSPLDPVVAARPHPREAPGKYRSLSDIPPKQVAAVTYEDLILASDLVAGMTSIALVHAIVADRPVLSLQPQLRGRDALVLGRMGLTNPVTTAPRNPEAARRLLTPPPLDDVPSQWTDGQSRQRLADLLEEVT